MRLILARHGESVANVARRYQGHDDPLTGRGRDQARRLAAALAARDDLLALYASPLARSWETATVVGQATGLTPTPVMDLREIECGEVVGLTPEEFAIRWPEEARRMPEGGLDWCFPGGETARVFQARVASAIERIVTAHEDQQGSVVIIAHGGALTWALAHLLGEEVTDWPAYRLNNCGITILEPDGGRHRLACLDDLTHLAGEAAR